MARRRKDDATEVMAAPATADGLRLTDHPRARRQIGAAKGWGGLIGFALGTLLAHRAGLPFSDALMRGMLAGTAAYVVAWGLAVVVWRQFARAEVELLRRMFEAAHAQAEAESERRRRDRALSDGSTA